MTFKVSEWNLYYTAYLQHSREQKHSKDRYGLNPSQIYLCWYYYRYSSHCRLARSLVPVIFCIPPFLSFRCACLSGKAWQIAKCSHCFSLNVNLWKYKMRKTCLVFPFLLHIKSILLQTESPSIQDTKTVQRCKVQHLRALSGHRNL